MLFVITAVVVTFQLTQIVPRALLVVCGLVFASAGRRSADGCRVTRE